MKFRSLIAVSAVLAATVVGAGAGTANAAVGSWSTKSKAVSLTTNVYLPDIARCAKLTVTGTLKYESYSSAAVYVRDIRLVAPKVNVITKAVSTKCSSTTTKTVTKVDLSQTWWDHGCSFEPSLSIGLGGWIPSVGATWSCSNVEMLRRSTAYSTSNYTYTQSNTNTTLWWNGQRQLAYGGQTCVDVAASANVYVSSTSESVDINRSVCITQTEAAN